MSRGIDRGFAPVPPARSVAKNGKFGADVGFTDADWEFRLTTALISVQCLPPK